jgi:fatty acid desaturase
MEYQVSVAASRAAVRISREDLKRLSTLAAPRGFATIALQWLVIAAAIAFAEFTNSWIAAGVAIVVIATRQHALAVLMHDASHHLLSRNKRLNDAVSSVLLSFPILTSTSRYRTHHLLHHQHVNTEQDPDLENTVCAPSRIALTKQLLADLAGINAIKTLTTLSHFGIIGPLFKPAGALDGISAFEKRLAIGFYLTVIAGVTIAGIWPEFLLYWILPLATVLAPILRFRALAEHGGCPDSHELNMARTVHAGYLERFLLAPCNVNYHLEHHLYPSIPFYNLPRLSRLLRDKPVFEANAHMNDGYFVGDPSVFEEVTTGRVPALLQDTAK